MLKRMLCEHPFSLQTKSANRDRLRETKLFFTKFERRCTKVQQSKNFVKALENTIKIFIPYTKQSSFNAEMKLDFCIIFSFKGVKNEFLFGLKGCL